MRRNTLSNLSYIVQKLFKLILQPIAMPLLMIALVAFLLITPMTCHVAVTPQSEKSRSDH